MEISKVMYKLLISQKIISLKIKQYEMDFGLAYITLFRVHYQNICVDYFFVLREIISTWYTNNQMIVTKKLF